MRERMRAAHDATAGATRPRSSHWAHHVSAMRALSCLSPVDCVDAPGYHAAARRRKRNDGLALDCHTYPAICQQGYAMIKALFAALLVGGIVLIAFGFQ